MLINNDSFTDFPWKPHRMVFFSTEELDYTPLDQCVEGDIDGDGEPDMSLESDDELYCYDDEAEAASGQMEDFSGALKAGEGPYGELPPESRQTIYDSYQTYFQPYQSLYLSTLGGIESDYETGASALTDETGRLLAPYLVAPDSDAPTVPDETPRPAAPQHPAAQSISVSGSLEGDGATGIEATLTSGNTISAVVQQCMSNSATKAKVAEYYGMTGYNPADDPNGIQILQKLFPWSGGQAAGPPLVTVHGAELKEDPLKVHHPKVGDYVQIMPTGEVIVTRGEASSDTPAPGVDGEVDGEADDEPSPDSVATETGSTVAEPPSSFRPTEDMLTALDSINLPDSPSKDLFDAIVGAMKNPPQMPDLSPPRPLEMKGGMGRMDDLVRPFALSDLSSSARQDLQRYTEQKSEWTQQIQSSVTQLTELAQSEPPDPNAIHALGQLLIMDKSDMDVSALPNLSDNLVEIAVKNGALLLVEDGDEPAEGTEIFVYNGNRYTINPEGGQKNLAVQYLFKSNSLGEWEPTAVEDDGTGDVPNIEPDASGERHPEHLSEVDSIFQLVAYIHDQYPEAEILGTPTLTPSFDGDKTIKTVTITWMMRGVGETADRPYVTTGVSSHNNVARSHREAFQNAVTNLEATYNARKEADRTALTFNSDFKKYPLLRGNLARLNDAYNVSLDFSEPTETELDNGKLGVKVDANLTFYLMGHPIRVLTTGEGASIPKARADAVKKIRKEELDNAIEDAFERVTLQEDVEAELGDGPVSAVRRFRQEYADHGFLRSTSKYMESKMAERAEEAAKQERMMFGGTFERKTPQMLSEMVASMVQGNDIPGARARLQEYTKNFIRACAEDPTYAPGQPLQFDYVTMDDAGNLFVVPCVFNRGQITMGSGEQQITETMTYHTHHGETFQERPVRDFNLFTDHPRGGRDDPALERASKSARYASNLAETYRTETDPNHPQFVFHEERIVSEGRSGPDRERIGAYNQQVGMNVEGAYDLVERIFQRAQNSEGGPPPEFDLANGHRRPLNNTTSLIEGHQVGVVGLSGLTNGVRFTPQATLSS